MEVSRNSVVAAARSYLRVPYMHQGRTRHGLDCIGLVIRVAHDLGLSTYDIDGYARVPSGMRMARLISEQCKKINVADILPGDLLHLAYDTEPQHLVLVTDMGIIHADSQRGVVEHVLDLSYRRRIRGAYALPGVI